MQDPELPFELDDKLIFATILMAQRSFLGIAGAARCSPIDIMTVRACASP